MIVNHPPRDLLRFSVLFLFSSVLVTLRLIFMTLGVLSFDLERVFRAVRRATSVVPQLAGQRVPRQRGCRLLHESATVRQVHA